QQLLDGFEDGDSRLRYWVGSIGEGMDTWYFTNKYKEYFPTSNTEEFSVLLRIAETYLIAAEAYAQLGQLDLALVYLNAIRERAALEPLEALNQMEILTAILQERKMELFSEHGHRF